jgi:hypothetical protein
MGNPWNITGNKDKSGKEKEFRSFEELKEEGKRRLREVILKETNAEIRIRNEVRKRKSELEKKAMEFFENPAGITEVTIKVCDYFEKTRSMDWKERIELENTVLKTIIIPLEVNRKIEGTRIMKKVCSECGIFYVPLLQDKDLIKPK